MNTPGAAHLGFRFGRRAASLAWRGAATSSAAWSSLRAIPGYALRHLVVLFALLGTVSLWDAWGDGTLPGFSSLIVADKDPHRVSSPQCIMAQTGDEERWLALAPALAILDEVNPEVAEWVRDRHARGKLIFSNGYVRPDDNRSSLARYDHFRGRLTIQRGLFAEKDGQIAAILCHEYRHSRQNLAKLLRCALSFVLRADGDRSILENDAELYEHEAEIAIFGGGRLNIADAVSPPSAQPERPSTRAILAQFESGSAGRVTSDSPHHR